MPATGEWKISINLNSEWAEPLTSTAADAVSQAPSQSCLGLQSGVTDKHSLMPSLLQVTNCAVVYTHAIQHKGHHKG